MKTIGFVLASFASAVRAWRGHIPSRHTAVDSIEKTLNGFSLRDPSSSAPHPLPLESEGVESVNPLRPLKALLLASSPALACKHRGSRHALSQHRRASKARSLSPLALDPGELWSSYLGLLSSAPLPTKAVTAGVIIGAGDCAAQLLESRTTNQDFDIARALRWAVFGLVLQGPWNHAFYLLLDGALPPTPDPWTITTLEKVFVDQFIQAPIFTVIILCFFAIVEGKGLDFAKAQVQNDLGGILVKNWGVFLPATVINLAFCPPELRVLFLNTVFFGWVCYLSLLLNADDADGAAKS